MKKSSNFTVREQINAKWIKTALLSYFRYTRQWVCATEVLSTGGSAADVLVDTGSKIIEVEVKIEKSDLLNDSLKPKHKIILSSRNKTFVPNLFYFCVPEFLLEEAIEVIERTNPKYGLILYCPNYQNQRFEDRLSYYRQAKELKTGFSDLHRKALIKRMCSELITFHQKNCKS